MLRELRLSSSERKRFRVVYLRRLGERSLSSRAPVSDNVRPGSSRARFLLITAGFPTVTAGFTTVTAGLCITHSGDTGDEFLDECDSDSLFSNRKCGGFRGSSLGSGGLVKCGLLIMSARFALSRIHAANSSSDRTTCLRMKFMKAYAVIVCRTLCNSA